MIFHDKKKAITTIMAKRHPETGEVTSAPMKAELPTKSEDGEIDPRHSAAQDVLAAIHEKSAQKLSEAMTKFFEASEKMPHEEAEHEESEG